MSEHGSVGAEPAPEMTGGAGARVSNSVLTGGTSAGPRSVRVQIPATGAQWEIVRGDTQVKVCALAAGLRAFRRSGVALVAEYADDAIAPGGAGITLAPWPNRVAEGKWIWRNREQQLDITEPALGNAIHGLLRNTGYTLADLGKYHVSLTASIFPQHGYPFHLEHTVTYVLQEDESLEVRQELRNLGPDAAPVALGAHPYLCLGDAPPEELTLEFTAMSMMENNESNIPVRTVSCGGPTSINVGQDEADNCYTGIEVVSPSGASLSVDTASGGGATRGVHEFQLRDRSNRTVALWAESPLDYVQIYVNKKFPGLGRAIAVEPMSAPANAYNSGEGLAWLNPGETFSVHWGIRAEI